MPRKRVCVIGAGPSGLTTLHALQKLDTETDYEVVCFERYDKIGGIWNFQGKEGVEEDGLEVHSGMYHNLITNGPKESVELPDHLFPLDDPELTGYPCFPDRPYMYKYLESYAEKFGLMKFVKFKTWVEDVKFEDETEHFIVRVKDLDTSESRIEEPFDFVIVATGHFNYPNYVSYPGQETFKGQVLHSKHFIDGERYKGKRILVVGASYSAEDIAFQTLRAGAAHVTISYRTKPMQATWPEGIDQRQLLERIEGNTVSFIDGSKDDYDVIVYCTGYLHLFPFMEERLRLETHNRMAPPLYKQIVLPQNPKVFYIGMQDQYYTFTMFWLQGHFVASMIKGDISVPSKEEMLSEITQSQKQEAELKNCYDDIRFQTTYVNELAKLTGQVSVDSAELFYVWEEDRHVDTSTYKEKTHFQSLFR